MECSCGITSRGPVPRVPLLGMPSLLPWLSCGLGSWVILICIQGWESFQWRKDRASQSPSTREEEQFPASGSDHTTIGTLQWQWSKIWSYCSLLSHASLLVHVRMYVYTHICITDVRYSSCNRPSDTTGIKEAYFGTSLVVQGLRLCTSNAGGVGAILARELRFLMPRGQEKRMKERNVPPPDSHSHTSSLAQCPPLEGLPCDSPGSFLGTLSTFTHTHTFVPAKMRSGYLIWYFLKI